MADPSDQDILLGTLADSFGQPLRVPLPRSAFARHTAIVAQSGAGKSFMLARLLEELVLKTRARLLILDPNSDFVRLADPEPQVWKSPSLTPLLAKGETFAAFRSSWGRRSFILFTNRQMATRATVKPIRLLASSLDESELTSLLKVSIARGTGRYWILVTALAFARERYPRGFSLEELSECVGVLGDALLRDEGLGEDWTSLQSFPYAKTLAGKEDISGVQTHLRLTKAADIWERSDSFSRYLPPDVRGALQAGFLTETLSSQVATVDLQSLRTPHERQLTLELFLKTAWDWSTARQSRRLEDPSGPWEARRSPLFLVIDEAHNLIPSQRLRTNEVHDAIVRIAAEGRKYDLFLILVSQSPRKIEPDVLSQCENLILMKTTGDSDLRSVSDVLGYPPLEVARWATTFNPGEAVLAGRLAPYPLRIRALPRRTKEGGKSLGRGWEVPGAP